MLSINLISNSKTCNFCNRVICVLNMLIMRGRGSNSFGRKTPPFSLNLNQEKHKLKMRIKKSRYLSNITLRNSLRTLGNLCEDEQISVILD